MLKIFSKVRQKLVSGNRFGKYLLYALGEIVLVVIGILIALQINEWNEKNQHNKEEKRILLSMLKDIVNDTVQLASNINNAENRTAIMDTVYLALRNPQQFTPSQFLQKAFVLASNDEFKVNSGTFDESLSSGSLKYIRNDQLRQQIFEYYRNNKLNENDKYATQQKYDIVFPVMFKTLSTSKEFFEQYLGQSTDFETIDIEHLSRNIEFIAAVNQRYASENNQIGYWHHVISTSRSLITKLTQELESF